MENLQKTYTFLLLSQKQILSFWFSKIPTTKTLIYRQLIDDHDEIIENAKSVLQTVQNTLTTAGIHNISTQHFLQDINFNVETYIEALKVSKRGPNVILQ